MDLKPFAHQELLETLSQTSGAGSGSVASSRNGQHSTNRSINSRSMNGSLSLGGGGGGGSVRSGQALQQQQQNLYHSYANQSATASVSSSHVDEAYRRVGYRLSMQAHGADERQIQSSSASQHSISTLSLTPKKPHRPLPYAGPNISPFLPYQQYVSNTNLERSSENSENKVGNSALLLRTHKVAKTNYSDHGEHASATKTGLAATAKQDHFDDLFSSTPKNMAMSGNKKKNDGSQSNVRSHSSPNILKRLTCQASDSFRKWQESGELRHEKPASAASAAASAEAAAIKSGITVQQQQIGTAGQAPPTPASLSSQHYAAFNQLGLDWDNSTCNSSTRTSPSAALRRQQQQQGFGGASIRHQQQQQQHLDANDYYRQQQQLLLRAQQQQQQLRQSHQSPISTNRSVHSSTGKGLLSAVMENHSENNSHESGEAIHQATAFASTPHGHHARQSGQSVMRPPPSSSPANQSITSAGSIKSNKQSFILSAGGNMKAPSKEQAATSIELTASFSTREPVGRGRCLTTPSGVCTNCCGTEITSFS